MCIRDSAIMVGNPAKQLGWISHSGEKLDENLTCHRDGRKYRIDEDGNLHELEVKHTTS